MKVQIVRKATEGLVQQGFCNMRDFVSVELFVKNNPQKTIFFGFIF